MMSRPHGRAGPRRPLPHRPAHRPGRDGQRLRGHRPPARPHLRGQGDAPGARRRRGVRGPLRARGPRRPPGSRPPQRRRGLRPGRRRRHACSWSMELRRRAHAARRHPQGEPDVAGHGARAGRAGALGARRRAPRRADPPRREARERPDRRRRPGQGRRLRAGQGRQRRHPAHRDGRRPDRHGLLPGPRAGRRRPLRRARRRVRRRRDALRAAHRPQAARGRVADPVAYKHVHEDVPPPSRPVPGIPAYVDALVARATARDREQRPADAGVLLHQVRRVGQAVRAGVREDEELARDLAPQPAGGSGRDLQTPSPDPFDVDESPDVATEVAPPTRHPRWRPGPRRQRRPARRRPPTTGGVARITKVRARAARARARCSCCSHCCSSRRRRRRVVVRLGAATPPRPACSG